MYAQRLIALSPPKLFDMIFDKKSHIPNYEGRAMAFIIVVMKILLGLDSVTEYEVSNVADRINRYVLSLLRCVKFVATFFLCD